MLQADRYVGSIDAGRYDILLQMLHRHHHGGLPVEGHPSRHHLIHHDAQGIDIALGVAVAAPGLLRGRIVNGSHRIRGIRVGGNGFRDSKVRHLHFPFPGNNNILGLDVPVHNTVVVRHLQTGGHLDSDAGRLLDRQPALFLDIGLQRDAFHQLHDNVVDVHLVAHVVDVHDIRVGQGRGGLRLFLELADKILILRKFVLEHLHGHKAVQLVILALEDLRHASGSYLLQNLIAVS